MTTTFHVHHPFLYISFPFFFDNHVKLPNFAFYRKKKKTSNDENFFLLLNLDMVSKNSIPGGFAYVLVAVASLNLKTPIKKFENDRVAR